MGSDDNFFFLDFARACYTHTVTDQNHAHYLSQSFALQKYDLKSPDRSKRPFHRDANTLKCHSRPQSPAYHKKHCILSTGVVVPKYHSASALRFAQLQALDSKGIVPVSFTGNRESLPSTDANLIL